MQTSQKLPSDLVIEGFMSTSGARPPGKVYRTAVPSSASEAYVVGDQWVNTAPVEVGTEGAKYVVEGGSCTVAGSPGTWVEKRTLTSK